MIPTYTYNIKADIINSYLGSNLAIVLVNNSALAITDTPTAQELEARRNFTATDLFSYEIGASALNGYARKLLTPIDINPVVISTTLTEAEISVSFTASGGDMDAFTHIVALRGANITNADALLNGNNRGDTNGTIIFVEPVENLVNPGTALTVLNGNSFNYTFKLVSASETI